MSASTYLGCFSIHSDVDQGLQVKVASLVASTALITLIAGGVELILLNVNGEPGIAVVISSLVFLLLFGVGIPSCTLYAMAQRSTNLLMTAIFGHCANAFCSLLTIVTVWWSYRAIRGYCTDPEYGCAAAFANASKCAVSVQGFGGRNGQAQEVIIPESLCGDGLVVECVVNTVVALLIIFLSARAGLMSQRLRPMYIVAPSLNNNIEVVGTSSTQVNVDTVQPATVQASVITAQPIVVKATLVS